MTIITQAIVAAVLLLSVVATVALLAWHGTLTGAEAFGALTTIISLGGGALAVHSGAKVGASAASPPSYPLSAVLSSTTADPPAAP
jgi:uncharacterized protein YaaW (UPF0174 family)